MSTTELYAARDTVASRIAQAPLSASPIYPIHVDDLRESGLTDSTIQQAGIFSCCDVDRARELLGRDVGSVLPAIVFPFFDIAGCPTGYCRVKPSRPRFDSNGRLVKYEAPSGRPNAAYFPPGVRLLIDQHDFVIITEGEKKALAACQHGFPTIGLSGVWGWSEKTADTEANGRKKLLDGLSVLPWDRLRVIVCFDSDVDTNHHVRRAEGALAAELKQQGATVNIARLPARRDGTKAGLDDFLVDYGIAELHRLLFRAYPFHIERWLPPNRWERPLDVFRNDMRQARLASLPSPGIVSFDGSPIGSGKSFADREIMENGRRTLTLLPVHANLRESAKELRQAGFDADEYGKLEPSSCKNWLKAGSAQAMGLPPTLTVCPECPFRNDCRRNGYLAQRKRAEQATHALATHDRAHRGLDRLLVNREVLFVHEDVTKFLRPSVTTSFSQIFNISEISKLAAEHSARFGDVANQEFFTQLHRTADTLIGAARQTALVTEATVTPRPGPPPDDWSLMLAETVVSTGSRLHGDSLRVVMDSMLGRNRSFVIPGYQDPKNPWGPLPASILAVWQTSFPTDCIVWLEDATTYFGHVQRLLPNVRVIDRTPLGTPHQRQPVQQIPIDVTTQESTAKKAVGLLRGVVLAHPKGTRFGVICHNNHLDAITEFANQNPGTLVKFDYFRSGRDRASNDWTQCDVLVVLGTPRVPPNAIREEVVRLGHVDAANGNGHWAQRRWIGETVDGGEIVIEGGGYLDPHWKLAYLNRVVALLMQAIGRSRFLLDKGVPLTLVFSNEPLQLPLLNPIGWNGVEDNSHRVFEALKRLAAGPQGLGNVSAMPLKDSFSSSADTAPPQGPAASRKDGWGVSTKEISVAAGIPERTVRDVLGKLADRGLVSRIGDRKGWLPVVFA
jgi:hypothetical protein